jgi:hypothetical protein
MYYFERLAPFILAVQEVQPEIITSLRDMQSDLIDTIRINQERLSNIYCTDEYELSLIFMDIMSGLDEKIILEYYEDKYSTACDMKIENLLEKLNNEESHSKKSEMKNIEIQIEELEKAKNDYIKNQAKIINELTNEAKEKYHKTLKFPMPGKLRLTDLLHEYDFIKIAAFYFYLRDHKHPTLKLMSDEIETTEKQKITKKHLFPISDHINDVDDNGNPIKHCPLIIPPDFFKHRRWKIQMPISSMAIGKLEEYSNGYILDIKTSIKIRKNCKIDDAALLHSIKEAILTSMCSHIWTDASVDPGNCLSTINVLSENNKIKQKQHDKSTEKLLNGYAIINLLSSENTVKAAIESMMERFKEIYEEKHPYELCRLNRDYNHARSKVKKCREWIDRNNRNACNNSNVN